MARFQTGQNKHTSRNNIVSILMFLVIILAFYFGISSLSTRSTAEQKDNLSAAITRGINQCYAVEGSYPESLTYLKEHYGLNYDETVFYVDYRVEGSNIMPDVTIIEKGE